MNYPRYKGEFVTEDTLLTARKDLENLGDIDMDLLSNVEYTNTQHQTGEFLNQPEDFQASDFDPGVMDFNQEQPVEFSIHYTDTHTVSPVSPGQQTIKLQPPTPAPGTPQVCPYFGRHHLQHELCCAKYTCALICLKITDILGHTFKL